MAKPPPPPTIKKPPTPKTPPQPKAPKPNAGPTHTVKTFTPSPWHGTNEGEKITAYGESGMGKTTLAALAPNPIFLGLDDGGRKIRNGITGEPIRHIPGIETFEDVRDALHQANIWSAGVTAVIDTVTKLEELAEPYMFATIKKDKGGTVQSLEGYGFGKGYKHSLDTMRLGLQDLDALVRRGVNVILICQQQAVKIANAEGSDYIQNGPKLHHNAQHSTRLQVCEWSDHVVRIGYTNQSVAVTGDNTVGKVRGSTDRVVCVCPENPSYVAKSRTMGNMKDSDGDPITRVSFESPADDTLWRFIFPEAYAHEDA